jgi:hypothetical protein
MWEMGFSKILIMSEMILEQELFNILCLKHTM